MTDKSDDIKQLFSHLGLDANVYQEMRTASRPSVTLTETPRRWSLLQSVAQPPAVTPVVPAAATPPVSSMPPAPMVQAPDRLNPSAFTPAASDDPATAPRALVAAPSLPAAQAGVHRREPATPLWPSATAAPAAATTSASAPGRMSADESLRLLFQAVREPGPGSGPSSADGYEAMPAIAQPMVPADDAPATAAMPIPSGIGEGAAGARMPATHGHNRPTRNSLLAASSAAAEETPRFSPPNVVAPAAAGGSSQGDSLGALFERLRGAPETPGLAPGRLRLNVPKAP